MSSVTNGEALVAEEIQDELEGLGQWWRRSPPKTKAAQQREQATSTAERYCGLEESALRQAATARTRVQNSLDAAAREIPNAQARRKALLAQAQNYKAAARSWEDKAAMYGRQCRGTAKAFSI